MQSRSREVTFIFDTLVVLQKIKIRDYFRFSIVVWHSKKRFTHKINYFIQKPNQTLDIKCDFQIEPEMLKFPALLTVYSTGVKLVEEKIDIRTNVIGALRFKAGDKKVSITFRVLNSLKDKIVIYKVPKFKLSDFKKIRSLESGSYGKIDEVVDTNGKSHIFKIMNQRIDINNRDDTTIREITPLIAFEKHPCIIKLDGFIYDKNCGIILVLEYVSRGRIDTLDFEKLSEKIKYRIIYGLLSCVAFLHDHGFIHRDISPSNVLVSDDYETKLIDFGVSRFICDEMTQDVGKQRYQSPDIQNSRNYNELVDEYSIYILTFNIKDGISLLINSLKHLYFLGISQKQEKLHISCSEVCLLIENNLFSLNSTDINEYCSVLSKYHESSALCDKSLYLCYQFALYTQTPDEWCDLLKLMDNCLANYREIYNNQFFRFHVNYLKGIAIDTKYFDPDVYDIKIDELIGKIPFENFISIDKLDLYFYQFVGGFFDNVVKYDDSPYESIFNVYAHIYHISNLEKCLSSADSYSCGKRYGFELYKYLFHDLINIMNYFDKPEMMEILLDHFNEMNIISIKDDFIKLFEYATKFKIVTAYEILGSLKTRRNGDYNKKSKYYADIAYRNGRFKVAGSIGVYYMNNNNMSEALKYFEIGSKYNDVISHFSLDKMTDNYNIVNNLERTANEGDCMSHIYLAAYYFIGYGTPQNFEQAYYHNYFGLEAGAPASFLLDGIFNFFGIVVVRDFTKARISFEKYVKPEVEEFKPNDEFFSIFLSIIHFLGLDVQIDIEKARKYATFLYGKNISKYCLEGMIYVKNIIFNDKEYEEMYCKINEEFKSTDKWKHLFQSILNTMWKIIFKDLNYPWNTVK